MMRELYWIPEIDPISWAPQTWATGVYDAEEGTAVSLGALEISCYTRAHSGWCGRDVAFPGG
jgi:hypothetical protein